VPLLNAPEFVLDDVTGCDAVVADAELLLKAVPTLGLVDATTLTGTWGRPFNDPDLKWKILLQQKSADKYSCRACVAKIVK
jgi:hypothetical protein